MPNLRYMLAMALAPWSLCMPVLGLGQHVLNVAALYNCGVSVLVKLIYNADCAACQVSPFKIDASLLDICQTVAEVKGWTMDEAAQRTYANFKDFYAVQLDSLARANST
eukprot:jgi/Chrzof1/3308/Cz12g20120.t1